MQSPFRRRALTAIFVAAALVGGGLVAAPSAVAATATVEGENPDATTFTPGVQAVDPSSGGRILTLQTDDAAPAGGYTASYTLTAASAGDYALEITAQQQGVKWTSPATVRIDDGPEIALVSAQEIGGPSDLLRTYRLPLGLRDAGPISVRFTVTERRSEPDTAYAFRIDALTLSATPNPQLAREGENPSSTNMQPGTQALSEGSGGSALWLQTSGDPSAGGYVAKYLIDVPKTGSYDFFATTAKAGVAWISTAEYRINGGAYRPLNSATEAAVVSPLMSTYRLGAEFVGGGTATVEFRVQARRSEPDTNYSFIIDEIHLTPRPTPELVVEGENAESSTMTPGVAALTGASGGFAQWVQTSQEPPQGGYTATYRVGSSKGGVFAIDATGFLANVPWASDATFQIDDRTPVDWSTLPEMAKINDQLATYRVGTITLEPGGSVRVKVTVNTRRSSPDTNYSFALDKIELTPTTLTLNSFSAPDRLGVFSAGEDATAVIALNAETSVALPVSWTASDYGRSPVASGSATIPAGERSVEVDLGTALPTGYYALSATAGQAGTVTGSLAVLPADAANAENSPFAADVGGSWLLPTANMETFAGILQKIGMPWIRERTSWDEGINPSPGQFDFSGQTRERTWFTIAQAHGLKVLNMYSSAPTWTSEPGRVIPRDLLAGYDYGKAAGANGQGRVDGWQLWNEPNLGFAAPLDGPDTYAAFLKATAIGFVDSGTDALLSTAGEAGLSPWYVDELYKSGALDYVDAYAYHSHTTGNYAATYNPLPDGTPQIDAARPYGGDAKQRWVTEAGIALATDGLPDEQQNRSQARYVVTSAIESLAEGATRHFFFVETPFREGTNFWSAFRDADEPMASVVSQAVLVRQLGAGAYVGEIAGLGDGVHAHVLADGDTSVTALWAAKPTTVTVSVRGLQSATTMMGGEAAHQSAGDTVTLTVGSDPIFLRSTSKPAGVIGKSVAAPTAPTVSVRGFTAAERIVVGARWPDDVAATAQIDGYALPTDKPVSLTYDVANLSDTDQTVTLAVAPVEGWDVTLASTSVRVPARTTVPVAATIQARTGVVDSLVDVTVTPALGATKGTPIVSGIRPVRARLTATHVARGTADALRVAYTNVGSTMQSVDHIEWTFPSGTTQDRRQTTVAPGATATFESAIVAPAGVIPYTAKVVFADGTSRSVSGKLATSRDVPVTITPGTVTADGVKDAGIDVPIQLRSDGLDPNSISAKAGFVYDDKGLGVTVVVHDDAQVQPYTGVSTWRGDSVQFAIAPGRPGETDVRPGSQPVYEYAMALTSAGPQLYLHNGTGQQNGPIGDAALAIGRDEAAKTTTYEVVLPWKDIPLVRAADATAVSVSMAVNDNDDGAHRSWVELGSGITTHKDTQTFVAARYVDATAPTVTGLPADGTLVSDAQPLQLAVSAADPESGIARLTVTWDGKAVGPTDALPLAGAAGKHVLKVVAENNNGQVTEASATVSVYHVEKVTSAPATGSLSTTSGWSGLRDGYYDVTMNLWWGVNGSLFRLYENGTLISTQVLNPSSPSAQRAVVPVRGRANGTYVYTGELVNGTGATATTSVTVRVTDAAPAKSTLANDNWDRDGRFTVTSHLWWGTNASSYRLYENGMLVDSQTLGMATPTGQHPATALTGRAPGTYIYVAELQNAFGTTRTDPMTVTVTRP